MLKILDSMGDSSPEMKRLLDYIDGQTSSDAFTRELETAVSAIKNNEKWRVEYMTLEMRYRELLEQGYEEGLEDGLERGLEQGLEQGITQTITTTISLFRENGFSDRQITEFLINKYKLSPEQAKNYIVTI